MLKKFLGILSLIIITLPNHCMEHQISICTEINVRNRVTSALKADNIKLIKKLTHFNKYIHEHTLNGAGFLGLLNKLELDINVLDEICCYNKMNYDLGNGSRYLQVRIRANQQNDRTDIILKFIKNASLKELNAQEHDGLTALQIAAELWQNEYYKIINNKADIYLSIIQELLRNGANPNISKSDGTKIKDLLYFQLFGEQAQQAIEQYNLNIEEVKYFKEEINNYVALKEESSIIEFLKDQHTQRYHFVAKYLPYIYKAAYNEQLRDVLKYIKLNCLNNVQDKIRCALKTNNLFKIKELTKFETFVTNEGNFEISAYREDIHNLNLDPMLADSVICREGVNYTIDSTDENYLNNLLKRNFLDKKCKKRILRFISMCLKTQIDIQEAATGNTILHEALYAHDRYKKINDTESMNNIEEIIKALLLKGANLKIINNRGDSPSHFAYFGGHIGRSQAKSSKITHVIETKNALKDNKVLSSSNKINETLNKSIDRKPNHLSKTLILAGISTVGAVALFYCGYKLLKSKTEKIGANQSRLRSYFAKAT